MEGLTKGIPDINLDWMAAYSNWKQDCYGGLRIEMKYGKNTLSSAQKEKKVLLEKAGYKWATCKTTKEAIQAVMDYLPFPAEDYIEPEYL